jgi:hypothetical protein
MPLVVLEFVILSWLLAAHARDDTYEFAAATA